MLGFHSEEMVPSTGGIHSRTHQGVGTVDGKRIFFLDPFAQVVQSGCRGSLELSSNVRFGSGKISGVTARAPAGRSPDRMARRLSR